MKYRKTNFFNDSFFFLCVVIFFIIFAALLVTYHTYSSYLDNNKQHLIETANLLDNTLQDILEETQYVMRYMGKHIIKSNSNILSTLTSVIGKNSNDPYESKTALSWIKDLGWITPDNQLIYNRKLGVLTPPIAIKSQWSSGILLRSSYLERCFRLPWKLHIASPKLNFTHGIWVIPVGMGITDNYSKYRGILAGLLSIADLNHRLQKLSTPYHSSYVLLDNKLRVILQSADNGIDLGNPYYSSLLKDSSILSNKGFLKKPIEYKDIIYSYSKKIERDGYSCYLLVGSNKKLQYQYYYLLLQLLFLLIGIGVFCLVLLYSFHSKILKIVQNSEKAKGEYKAKLKAQMKEPLDLIILYSSFLSKYFKGEIQVGMKPERQLQLIDKIHNLAANLDIVTTHTLQYTYIDLNQIIKECREIQAHKILTNNILIKSSFCVRLPLFHGDEMCLKQIIIGLLSLSIYYTPEGGTIKISTALKYETSKPIAIITIQDNGLVLNQEDIERIKYKIAPIPCFFDGIDFDFDKIKDLIKIHRGTFTIKALPNEGKLITLALPYEEEQDDKIGSEKTNSAVLLKLPY